MAKASTLVDPFTGSSLNTSNWTAESQGTVTVSGGKLTFSAVNGPSDDMYEAVNSNASYDATGCAVFVQLLPNTTVTQADTGFGYWSSGLVNGWTMGVVVNGVTSGVTSAYVQKWVNNNFTFVWSATYNATTHAWMQISESGGTLSFQVSATGQSGSWTTVYSTTSENITGGGNNLSLSSVTQEIYFGFQDNVKRSGSASFANYNVAPGGGGGGGGSGSARVPSPPLLGMYEENSSGTSLFPGAPSAWPSGSQTNIAAGYFAMDPTDLFSTYGTPFINECVANGLIAFVEIEPWGYNQAGVPFANITGGSWDTYFEQVGAAIAAAATTVIVTFAHEMNVSGQYPWAWHATESGLTGCGPGGADLTPAQWQAAWKYAHDKVNASAGGHAVWIWAAAADTGGSSTTSPSPWWPGSSYADMVGVDAYEGLEGGPTNFSALLASTLSDIAALGWTDPIYIAETNLALMVQSGGDSIAAFVADMHANNISGIMEFEVSGLPSMTSTQWTQYHNAVASYTWGPPSGGGAAASALLSVSIA